MRDGGVNECTSGWSVRRISDGATGVVTAAHCEGIDRFVQTGVGAYSAPFLAPEHIGPWGEVEWHTTTHVELAEFYATSTSIRNVTAIEPYGDVMVDESVCVYGRDTDTRNCSLDVRFTRVLATFFWEGCNCVVNADRLVEMDGRQVMAGDSGGGWSMNTRAYGITHGFSNAPGGGDIWSPASLFEQAIGVRVMLQ